MASNQQWNQTNKTSQQGVYGKLKNTVFITPFRKSYPLHQTVDDDPVISYGSTSLPFLSTSTPHKTEKKAGHDSYNKKLMKILTRGHKSAGKVGKKVDDGEGNNNDDQFSKYINRVKGGMRSEADIGTETVPPKKVSRRDSLNDKVSNFLSQARIKIRTTSSLGHMKSKSIKGKGNNYE